MPVFKYKVHAQGFVYSGEMEAASPVELRNKLSRHLGVEVHTQNLLFKGKRSYFSGTGIGKPILSVFLISASFSGLWFLVGLKIAMASGCIATMIASSQYFAGWNKARLELKTAESQKALADSKKELKYLDVLDKVIESATEGHLTQDFINKLKESNIKNDAGMENN